MFVRKAEKPDLPAILEIYAHARDFMAANGNPTQWGSHYPPEDLLWEDIQAGNLYVVREDSKLRGVFALIPGTDPTYLQIDGAWNSERPYGAIHRVAADGSGGVFGVILDFCCRRMDYLRIDTHEENHPMRRVIEKNGFRYCGTIHTDDGTPRRAYDFAR